jgi:hypothetical protein
MDRRTFITGAGTLGAAAVGGWKVVETSASHARANGLAKAAGAGLYAPAAAKGASGSALADGFTVGYLIDSPYLFEYEAQGWGWESFATTMSWTRWSPAQSNGGSRLVRVSIGLFRAAQNVPALGMVRSLEVASFFAADGATVARFDSWRYQLDASTKRVNATSPLTFNGAMPDRLALQVNYTLDTAHLAPGMNTAGMVYMPLGGREGLGTGLHLLAGPSHWTGAAPNLADYRFTGSLANPVMRADRGQLDFDYVAIAVRPVKA